ncbi:hypothetical protein KC319_g19856, partial [Hortaea werneckii]
MSRTHPPNPQQADEDKKADPLHPTTSPSSPPFSLNSQQEKNNMQKAKEARKETEEEKEAKRKAELSRFLQYRARLEFVELMTRRQQDEEEVEEDEEVEREGRGRNVGRCSD